MESGKGALCGIRVIDFGQYLPGPLAAMILADYGADVVHVDPPGGPRWNEYEANAVLMRGKRNIMLDLKKADDKAVAARLIETADVVMENFRPGVMDRLGLGKDAFRTSNPALIYCSIPGFSACDERSALRGWEGIVEAEAGLYTDVRTDNVRFNALPMASVFAAVMACHSIVAALIVRLKCGRAQSIEVPMYDACFEAQGTRGVYPNVFSPAPPTGDRAESDYRLLLRMTKHPCKDGRYFQVTPPPRGARMMVDAVMRAEWNREAPISPEHDRELAGIVAQHTALEWETISQEEYKAGVVMAQTSQEWMEDASAVDSRSVIRLRDPVLGNTSQPGVPALTFIAGDCAGEKPRTLPDEDRVSILAELKTRHVPKIEITGDAEPPLKGLKVLDFCQVLAGPICGRLLAEYGAEVLKINNPRTYENPVAMVGHETVNNGKLTVYIDLKSDEGKWILDNLIRECDIFHCNFSQSAYENLGITEEKLHGKNPSIIFSQVNLHSIGGWRERERGHEDLGEAVSGIACRYSGTLKPKTVPILICDNLTGHSAALGVLLSVYWRMLTGEGQRTQACLSRSATFAQLPYMLGYKGKVWNEPSGPNACGWSIFDRLYHTADGAVFIASADAEHMAAVSGLEGIDFNSKGAEASLAERFKTDTSAAWYEKLCGAKAECRVLRNFSRDVMEEPYAKARGLSRRDMHRGLGELRVASCSPRLSLTPPIPGFPVSAAGEDTDEFIAGFKAAHVRD